MVPDDRTVVVERFRDEIGDWRVCLLSPFGTPVHAPWAMAIERRLSDRYDMAVETMWSDDGIVIRLPEAADEIPTDELMLDPAEIDELVLSTLPSTPLFSSRFRECAARALLLPRRRPDSRTPLWQQRQRAADLLAVAAKYPTFPILLEASRECLQDVFDVPALRTVLTDLRSRKIRLVSVDTQKASPFAQSLLFNWIAAYMYEGDAPLAERRAAALALDRDLLRELLGAEELRELIDPEVLADLELELQCLVEHRRARSADEQHDLLRRLGDLSLPELDVRADGTPGVAADVDRPAGRRAAGLRAAGGGRGALRRRRGRRPLPRRARRGAAPRAAPRLHRAGRAPAGVPRRSLRPHPRAVPGRGRRPAPRHPGGAGRRVRCRRSTPRAGWCGASSGPTASSVSGATTRCCASCAAARSPRCARRSSRSSPTPWPGSCRCGRAWARPGAAWTPWWRRSRVLQGAAMPASVLDSEVLAQRVSGYRPADLDALCTSGELVWIGAGPLGSRDGRVRLYFRDQVAVLAPRPADDDRPSGAVHDALRQHLALRGACFWADLRAGCARRHRRRAAGRVVGPGVGGRGHQRLAGPRAVLRGGRRRQARRGGSRPAARPRPGRLSRLGPPSGAGRWSLVAPLLEPVAHR